MSNYSLNERMKDYEKVSKGFLTKRVPVIIRCDGKAFHTFTKGLNKPFDELLIETMQMTTQYLCKNIQGCKLGYTQSDEISLLLIDYEKLTSDPFFEYNIQKIVSVSASMATLAFNLYFKELLEKYYQEGKITEEEYNKKQTKVMKGIFDSRAFNIPISDVCNYFVYRQKDGIRNSISMFGQHSVKGFGHKQLFKLSSEEIKEVMKSNFDLDWNNLSSAKKIGTCVKRKDILLEDTLTKRKKWIIDEETPIFTENREYIEELL